MATIGTGCGGGDPGPAALALERKLPDLLGPERDPRRVIVLIVTDDEESPAHLVVRTNATEFAQTGTATLIAAFQPDGEFQQIPFTAFAPAADDPGPTPNPIPLPPAAWATLATVGGLGAAKRLRRRG